MIIYYCEGDEEHLSCLFKDHLINETTIYAVEIFDRRNSRTNLSLQIDSRDIDEAYECAGIQFDSAKFRVFCNTFGIKIVRYEDHLYVLDGKLIKECRRIE